MYLTDVVSARVGLVAVTPGPNVAAGTSRLLLSTDRGATFTSIGPQLPAGWNPESVSYLDRQHVWLAAWNLNTEAERIYRTSDGGHAWQFFPAKGHNMAAGSRDTVQFVSPSRGWLVHAEPNGPGQTLFSSHNGGQTWQPVAVLSLTGGRGALPAVGRIEFGPGAALGWLGGEPFGGRMLYGTHNQGLSWQPAGLPTLANANFGLPSIFGATLLEPVTILPAGPCNNGPGGLRLYRSVDSGAHWSLISALPDVFANQCAGPTGLSASFPTPNAAWIAALDNGHITLRTTNDQGKHWTVVAPPSAAPAAMSPTVQAFDANHAWLITPLAPAQNGDAIWATSDAGQTWQRIDQTATQTAH